MNHFQIVFFASLLLACRSEDPAPLAPLAVEESQSSPSPLPIPTADGTLATHSETSVFPAPGEPAEVQLLAAGAEPRSILRWSHRPAYFVAILEYREDFYDGDDFKFGFIERATVDVAVVTDDAGSTARCVVTAHSRVSRGELPNYMPKDGSDLSGRVLSISPRGYDNTLPSAPESTLADGPLAALYSGIAGLWSPFPEDAVGVGARWQVKSARTYPTSDAQSQSSYIYEFAQRDGPSGRLTATLENPTKSPKGERGFHRRLSIRHDFHLDDPTKNTDSAKGTRVEFGAPAHLSEKAFRSEISYDLRAEAK